MKILTGTSHLDHGISQTLVRYLCERFADRDDFFLETIELSEELADGLECSLYGPLVGDEPVGDAFVCWAPRGERTWPSRIVQGRGKRPTRLLTVIAGPHDGYACILYTAFGGPAAPRELGDPSLPEEEKRAAFEFWSEHALVQ
jgi:hypothetical protein